MAIFGRSKEIEILNEIYQSDQAEFLALYGRRRVGKTFLIRQFFQAKENSVFFNVTGLKNGKMAEQLDNFIERIGEVFYDGLRLAKENYWRDAFSILNNAISKYSQNKKIVLFFDELPWMATPKSRLLQIIDYYWNQYWSNNPCIKFIICGSYASWIINKIIKNTGGLYNRITEKIFLKSFSLCDTENYLKSKHITLDRKQILLLYMVTGGVPYYLSKIKRKLSATEIIELLAFSEKGFLLDEFDNLFASLFNDHDMHIAIVRALAKSRYGIGKTKLLEQVGSVGSNSAKRLQELEDAGFIISFKPIYHKKKGIYYRLIDEYTCFYLKWIEPIKDTLQVQALDKGNWQIMRSTAEWNSWLGYAFESVCYKHLVQIRRALGILPTAIANTWRHVPRKNSPERGAQIDLLFDRKDDVINICEIKYTDRPFVITRDYFDMLNRKLTVFKEQTRSKKQLLLSFVTTNGLKKISILKK